MIWDLERVSDQPKAQQLPQCFINILIFKRSPVNLEVNWVLFQEQMNKRLQCQRMKTKALKNRYDTL